MSIIGKILNSRYEIIEQVGIGGMATVYKAKCTLLNRYVAVKVLKDEFSQDSDFVQRFKAEAQSAASLTHANIVSVYDVGEENGINYIVMELIEGTTLKEYITKNGPLPYDKVLKISMQIASALEAAHKHHIIHRDIKPHNIIITKDFTVKVTDFGIAKVAAMSTITDMNSTCGSVHYFSPEHAKGGYTDEKSDIYSLGIVMYEMSTGLLPFDGDSAVTVALKHIQQAPIPPIEIKKNIPIAVNDIILKAMEKNTSSRYASAAQMILDLYAALKNPEVPLRDHSSVEVNSLDNTQVIPIIGMNMVNDGNKNKVTVTSRKNKIEEEPQIDHFEMQMPSFEERYRMSEIEKANNSKKEIEQDKEEEENETKKEKPSSKNKKKRLIIIISIVSAIVLVAIGFGIFNLLSIIGGGNGPIVKTPNLVGKVYEEVLKEYEGKEITISLVDREFNNDVEEGKIIRQTPEADLTLKNNVIEVVVSKGKKKVLVPNLEKEEYKVAQYKLEQLGLVPEFDFVLSNEIAENLIIKQEPGKDTEVPIGTVIKIQVSKGNGKVKVVMPKLTDITESEARDIITKNKLICTKVTYIQDSSKPNGVVVYQSIPINTEVEEGSVVELQVNRLLKSKEITLDLSKYFTSEGSSDGASTTPDKAYSVKVVAVIEGISNTVYDKTHKDTEKTAKFTINGYTSATIKILVDGKQVSEQQITF